MKLGMLLGLGPGHVLLDGDPAPLPQTGAPKRGRGISGPYLLWPNGWMDQDATWYGGRPQPSNVVLDGDPPSPKRCTGPSFRPMSIVAERVDG